MTRFVHAAAIWFVITCSLLLTACHSDSHQDPASPSADAIPAATPDTSLLHGLDLDDLSNPRTSGEAVSISASKNEWTSFCLEVAPLPAIENGSYRLKLRNFELISADGQIAASNAEVFQILPMPVDVNRAGYVRHTGLSTRNQLLPRALLPVVSQQGVVDLNSLRDAGQPLNPRSRAVGSNQPSDLWIDLHIPPEAKAGHYRARCDIIASDNPRAVGTASIDLNVYDFVLPDDRHLMMVGQLNWSDLSRLYPDRFEAVTPRLVNRVDDRYRGSVRTLDELVTLAQKNRTQLAISRLQPTTKWPTGKPPQLYWDDYDSVVSPWIKGDIFPDKVGFGFWPMPADEHLANYDPKSRQDYWSAVAAHFDQADWIAKSAVMIEPDQRGGRSDTLESVKVSADASAILSVNSRVRVVVPIEDDQVQFASPDAPMLVKPQDASRLITANPGLVFTSPIQNWPTGVARPARWLRTDLAGLIPYVGAGGDERDVRLWSWLATVPLPPPPLGVQYGAVQMIRWPGALPQTSSPAEPADPNELVWFYPGSWFGVDAPVPTVQLKWLRRAQQDYEYLYLARQRGDTINSLLMARLVTKPVELSPSQTPDPSFGLMCGTADPAAWMQATDLLAQRILAREPGQSADAASVSNRQQLDSELNLRTLRWIQPQERPVIMGRSTQWLYDAPSNIAGPAGVDLHLGIDIYNPSDRTPDENLLQWSDGPVGWHWRPQPTHIPQLATYHVRRFEMNAHVESSEISNVDHKPQQITFTDGFTHTRTVSQMVLPTSVSERREGRLKIDGSLDDWSAEDAIQSGPLVRMFNRPALQTQELQLSTTPSSIFTGWADENFYIAFKVSGISSAEQRATKNWVSYEFRRAWGEDVCQMIIQPIYADGSVGPTMSIAVKPNGASWVQRKMTGPLYADPWQSFEGAEIRYAFQPDGADWRGEIAIPWKAINDPNQKNRPVMLRFNFTQHKTATGESASWAGPVDFGRDDAFTGLLFLRESNNPGMRGGTE